MKAMQSILFFVLLAGILSLSADVYHQARGEPNATKIKADALEGIYSIVGAEGQTHYTGTATIRRHGPDSYLIQSITTTLDDEGEPTGVQNSTGIGMIQGNSLSMAWRLADKSMVGLTVYTIKDGTLSGRWVTFPGPGEARVERLRKVAPLPKADKET